MLTRLFATEHELRYIPEILSESKMEGKCPESLQNMYCSLLSHFS